MSGVLGFRELGQMAYEPVWHAMQRFTNERHMKRVRRHHTSRQPKAAKA